MFVETEGINTLLRFTSLLLLDLNDSYRISHGTTSLASTSPIYVDTVRVSESRARKVKEKE